MRYTVIFETRMTPATSATVRNLTSARAGSTGRTAGCLLSSSPRVAGMSHRHLRHVSGRRLPHRRSGHARALPETSGTGGASAIAVPHLRGQLAGNPPVLSRVFGAEFPTALGRGLDG